METLNPFSPPFFIMIIFPIIIISFFLLALTLSWLPVCNPIRFPRGPVRPPDPTVPALRCCYIIILYSLALCLFVFAQPFNIGWMDMGPLCGRKKELKKTSTQHMLYQISADGWILCSLESCLGRVRVSARPQKLSLIHHGSSLEARQCRLRRRGLGDVRRSWA